MGIGTIFDIASSGIVAQRLAIEVTGENIANVNTEGYSRQQVLMENKPVTTANGFGMGTGVQIAEVRRSYDGMLQLQIVNGNSSYQESLTKQQALEQIEPSFNEITADGLGKAMENFFGAWQDLTTNPSGTAERQALLSRSQILVDTFHQVDSSLAGVAQTADNNLVGITAELTDNARNLALVNTQILATRSVGGNANELLDQRDLLIRKMSEKVGVTASLATDGTASVTLPGGEQLVSGTTYATIYTSVNGGTGSRDILITGLGNPPPAAGGGDTVVATAGGGGNLRGTLGGTLAIRDEVVPEYRDQLDEMANRLVTVVNTQHSLGYGLDGSTGNNFFDAASLTAADIKFDAALTSAKIAAALPTVADPVPTTSGNNVNALRIADLGSANTAFSTGNATFAGFYRALVGKVGVDTEEVQNLSTQGGAFLKQLNALRSSNSEVSLDEELTNLTLYQRAFQGSAKVINAATDMLDIVLGMVR